MPRPAPAALLLLLLASPALAQVERASSLDGAYLALGPVTGATYVESDWTSAVGLQVSALRVREGGLPAVIGLNVGGARLGGREGGRVWLEVAAGVRSPLPLPAGACLGAMVDLQDATRPRPGVHGTIWIYAGIIPYVRAGQVAGQGPFVEAGLQILLPTLRFL